jgi:RNA polymerase sigma factor (sigma-70 family)
MIQREPHQATEARTFDRHRPLLFSIAYRMLGSAMDAEDIVQEAYLRWQGTEDEVRSPKAYLSTVVTRLAIDRLRSAKARREQYVGPWLSEPLATGGAFDPAEAPVMEETLSMGCLVLLESLTPVERAIFLLREVNGQPGIIVYAGDLPDGVLTLEIAGGRIKAIRNVRNPDKLQAVPRLSEINRRWTATAG